MRSLSFQGPGGNQNQDKGNGGTGKDVRKESYLYETMEVLSALDSNIQLGLSSDQYKRRLNEYGRNEIPPEDPIPFYKLVAKQFEDFLVIILLVAAVLSFILALFEDKEDEKITAFVEPAVILLILIANATVGVIQEQNAENAIQALRAYEALECSVVRDGHNLAIPAAELVPGDIVILTTGCKIPADCRLINVQSSVLYVDQSPLTGEADPVAKDQAVTNPSAGNRQLMIQDKTNMLFSGTLVTRGRAVAIVVATGHETEFGKIHGDISGRNRSESAAEAEDKTPLKEKLDEFGVQLSKLIGAICILVWIINIHHFGDPSRGGWVNGALYYFKIAVALAVAAVPEGLPAVVTTCLALGTRAMAKEGAIVRSLPSVETLGCTTVICADKTGTLTTNRMSVRHIIVATATSPQGAPTFVNFEVDGEDYSPQGKITNTSNKSVIQQPALQHPILADVAFISALCNESQLYWDEANRRFERTGEPTEAALRALVEKIGLPQLSDTSISVPNIQAEIAKGATADEVSLAARFCSSFWEKEFELESVLEFTRQRKSMSVICTATGNNLSKRGTKSAFTPGQRVLFVKGAPESVIKRCKKMKIDSGELITINESIRSSILDMVSKMGDRSFRCVALAQGDAPPKGSIDLTNADKYESIEQNLVLIGITCMVDPPRPQVAFAVEQCIRAGIRLIVVTGDNQSTAEAVCESVGLLKSNSSASASKEHVHRRSGLSITGEEWMSMDEQHQAEAVDRIVVISRVEPEHKLRLVRQLKARGEVVAMTGDGVNDAPALTHADIGIAMGSGTAVAREASDMVLADDNFSTIVSAVRQGRTIFANTKQFIRYLISSNIGEVACIFIGAALGIPEALVPVQLLWVNFVTDGLPATALGFNPPDPNIMDQKPRPRNEQIVNRWTAIRYAVVGTYVGAAVVGGFIWWYISYSNGPKLTWEQLINWEKCGKTEMIEDSSVYSGPCSIFDAGAEGRLREAQTIALSILVTIEMFNAMNSVSENQSLLSVPFWINRQLVGAITLSFLLHFAILYIPWLSSIFDVTPIGSEEWWAIFLFSFPVIPIDEVLKFISRRGISTPNLAGYSKISMDESELSQGLDGDGSKAV